MAWSITQTVTNSKNVNNVSVMNINDNLSNHLPMANAFNKYFLSVPDDKIIHNYTNQSHFISNNINPSNYLHDALKQPFFNINLLAPEFGI